MADFFVLTDIFDHYCGSSFLLEETIEVYS